MLLRRAIVVIAIVVIAIVIAMIAVAIMGMLHRYVIALDEAFAIVVALVARYGGMPEHTRISRIHPTAVLNVEACCFDAIMEALSAGVAELRRRSVPPSRIALRGVAVPLLRSIWLRALLGALLRAFLLRALLLRSILLRAILLGMETDGRERSQCNCQKGCGETNGSHEDSLFGEDTPSA